MQLTVIEEHESPFPNPIQLKKGEQVRIEKRQTMYSGWVWTIAPNGNQGWTPESFLDIDWKKSMAITKECYNARELNVNVGDALTSFREVNKWYWVSTKDGEYGWVPKNKVTVSKVS